MAQLLRIEHYWHYLVDRLRLCRNQPIIDPKALPLMAIRQFPITRKSLGGIETDLHCRVIHQDGEASLIFMRLEKPPVLVVAA